MKDILVISYDDDELGEYFSKCRDDIQHFISQKPKFQPTIHCMHNDCCRNSIKTKVSMLADKYAVVVYAHGNDKEIKDKNGNTLIDTGDAQNYHNSIVYSTACLTANELGIEMTKYGCKIFFGYCDKTYGIENSCKARDIFIEAENHALKMILDGETDHSKIYNETFDCFSSKIAELETIDELAAPLLMHNREAIKLYGHPSHEFG